MTVKELKEYLSHYKDDVSDDSSPCFNFLLESDIPFDTQQMVDEVYGLIKNIKYWNQTEFKEYFSNDLC